MNQITNRQAINDTLVKAAKEDKDIVVVCSDSRGSASLGPFANEFPKQFVEMGIAEQNLVTVSAGLAAAGKKVFAASPACFLSTRSYEQAKVDVAYSETNVTLIGISGGVSYGALGMTHYSCQDIAAMAALPGMRVYLPSDRFQTEKLMEALLQDNKPAYVRVSRSATEDVYDENIKFELNKASLVCEGDDVAIITCGELVPYAKEAAKLLKEEGIHATVLDMYCIKPLDQEAVLSVSKKVKCILTVEEHSPFGGLGSMVSQLISANHPMKVVNLALPDGHIIGGSNKEIFSYYGLDAKGIADSAKRTLTNQ